MVTKLKEFSTSELARKSVFILIVALMTVMVNYFFWVNENVEEPGALLSDNYFMSTSFESELNSLVDDILNNRSIVSPYVSYYYKTTASESGDPNLTQTFPENDQFINMTYQDGTFYLLDNGINWYYLTDDAMAADPVSYFYLSIDPEYFAAQVEGFEQSHKFLIGHFNLFMALLLVNLLLIGFLCFATGKVPDQPDIALKRLDSLWSELTVTMIILGPTFFFVILDMLFYQSFGSESGYVFYFLMALNTAFWTSFTGIFFLSLVRKIKSRTFLKTMFCYRFFKGSMGKIKPFARMVIKKTGDIQIMKSASPTEQLRYREIVFILLSAAMVFFFAAFILAGSILFLVPILLEALLIYWLLKGNADILKDLETSYEAAVEERMKSERMKVELITNMSHDLKTPLTAIISYIDLLAKDETIEGPSREYLTILEDKSDKLKNIVASLFDLSKSSSGNLNLNLERLDLKKLLEQSLASFEDEITLSELIFKTEIPDQAVFIESDGSHLYRVFQNLLDNILKYAMAQSRVYIELATFEKNAVITMKNTSAQEICYSAQEILMRFTRGDQARESEGTGLGLSIAESFTQACGGTFELSIDGDLFKTSLTFPIAK